MKKLLFILALLLLPTAALAQCNGNFGANTACGSVAGGAPGPVPFSSIGGFLAPGTTIISPKTNGGVLYDNNGILGDSTTLPSGLTAPSFTVTTAFTATGLVTAADLFGTTGSAGNVVLATSPTITTPSIAGGALSGTFSGNPTFSGVPLLTGLSSGTCTNGLAINSSNQIIDVNCPGVATTITASSTAISGCTSGSLLWDNSSTLGCSNITGFLTAGYGIGVSGSTSATLAISLTTASNVLGSDTSLSNISNYFDGPSMAQGTSGVWAAYGTVTITDTSAGANIYCKLWDGTNAAVASGAASTVSANDDFTMSLSGNISSPAGNIRISCKDITSTSGKIKFNVTGNSTDSSIYGHRIQ